MNNLLKLRTYYTILCLSGLFLYGCQTTQSNVEEKVEWISLFNGQDINDWSVKIRGYELNDNFANTFSVEDGVMKVSYDGYEKFEDKFGHIFYNTPLFSLPASHRI